jgi:hypothetical protein
MIGLVTDVIGCNLISEPELDPYGIAAPAPALLKLYGSFQLRLHKTVRNRLILTLILTAWGS